MILGFLTSWPVNRVLLQKGWKEKMDPRARVGELLDESRAAA